MRVPRKDPALLRRQPSGRWTTQPSFETRLKPSTKALDLLPEWANIADETWCAIPGYVGIYEASVFGRVRRIAPGPATYVGRLLHPRFCGGYLQVILTKDGLQRFHYVHGLVALTFLGEPPEGMEVNHKDTYKTHNWLKNLEYTTPAGNIQHALANGLRRSFRGENNPKGRLSSAAVLQLRRIREDDPTITYVDLGRRFGISAHSARAAALGISWSHL